MRAALATLPWVEQRTIQPDRRTLLVRFGINDRSAFNEEQMRQALGSHYGKRVTVKEITETTPTSTPPTEKSGPEKSASE